VYRYRQVQAVVAALRISDDTNPADLGVELRTLFLRTMIPVTATRG
jgi:hypothetical protein